jgi:hypothetical protein
VKYFSIHYRVKNICERNFKNLKFFIYIYQIYEENLIYNSELKDDVFYEGCLENTIKELNSFDVNTFNVNLYPPENEQISTTCLIVDQSNQTIYMSPISQFFYLKSNI